MTDSRPKQPEGNVHSRRFPATLRTSPHRRTEPREIGSRGTERLLLSLILLLFITRDAIKNTVPPLPPFPYSTLTWSGRHRAPTRMTRRTTHFLPTSRRSLPNPRIRHESYPYLETLDDGQELHIGRPGSLYRIVSADEMASREREHSTAVAAPPPPAAKPAETIIRGSAFRRGIADCEERQIPGPRRFGFGTSPPRRGNDSRSSAPPSMIYDRPPSPRASSSNYSDTPRQTTILPPSSSAARALLLDASSPPLGRRMSVPTVRPSNDVRNIGTRTDVIIEDRQQPLPQSQQPTHPVFSQLALVLGFELAKRVTERHPHELDLNRLANLALDITAAPAAAAAVSEPAAPATPAASATPARSVSTTSAASAASTASLELQQRRRGNRSSFSRGGGNRSPQSDTTTTRRFGGGRVTSPLDRSARDTQRANSTPNDTADDTFVTAVSAATATVPPPLLPSPLPSLMDVPVEDATADASRASVAVEAVDVAVVYDLIDWEGEAASQEAVHPVSSAPLLVESSHLLD